MVAFSSKPILAIATSFSGSISVLAFLWRPKAAFVPNILVKASSNLSSVIIGNRELNDVQACVSQGQNAPLLFGQSALQKFGKVSIDYDSSEITFE